MIKGQVLPNKITNPEIIKIISDLPRENFVPELFKEAAYGDQNMFLGEGRYLIPAFIFARMAQELAVNKDEVVLDVACGTGYSSAVFSALAKKVVAIESNADLATRANSNLKKLELGNVIILNNKLQDGHAEGGPYNAICINGAITGTPHSLIDQLAEGGRLIAIVATNAKNGRVTIFKREAGKIVKTDLFDAAVNVIPEFRE